MVDMFKKIEHYRYESYDAVTPTMQKPTRRRTHDMELDQWSFTESDDESTP